MVAAHNKPLVLDRSLNHSRFQGNKREVVFFEEPSGECAQPSREWDLQALWVWPTPNRVDGKAHSRDWFTKGNYKSWFTTRDSFLIKYQSGGDNSNFGFGAFSGTSQTSGEEPQISSNQFVHHKHAQCTTTLTTYGSVYLKKQYENLSVHTHVCCVNIIYLAIEYDTEWGSWCVCPEYTEIESVFWFHSMS